MRLGQETHEVNLKPLIVPKSKQVPPHLKKKRSGGMLKETNVRAPSNQSWNIQATKQMN